MTEAESIEPSDQTAPAKSVDDRLTGFRPRACRATEAAGPSAPDRACPSWLLSWRCRPADSRAAPHRVRRVPHCWGLWPPPVRLIRHLRTLRAREPLWSSHGWRPVCAFLWMGSGMGAVRSAWRRFPGVVLPPVASWRLCPPGRLGWSGLWWPGPGPPPGHGAARVPGRVGRVGRGLAGPASRRVAPACGRPVRRVPWQGDFELWQEETVCVTAGPSTRHVAL